MAWSHSAERLLLLMTFCVLGYSSVSALVGLGCAMLNDCNGHGTCDTTTKTCDCDQGWGAATDIALYKSPDCSKRTCPSGPAWGDIPTSATAAHRQAECSNQGVCDRSTGICACFEGFHGEACQRRKCPNDCSKRGRCLSMRQMAQELEALPLSAATSYGESEEDSTWDSDMVYGCVCDSSWEVGLASGQTQEPEYFGPDCSLKHCPSGDDPMTTADETDCSGVTATGGRGVGAAGNKCHIDCSNRGVCDYETGTCECFEGFYGESCSTQNPYAT